MTGGVPWPTAGAYLRPQNRPTCRLNCLLNGRKNMFSLNRFRWLTQSLVVSSVLVAGESFAAPLVITSVEADPMAGKLYIYGEGFGTVTPSVKFAAFPTGVLAQQDTALTVSIPFGLLKTPGTYLLSVSEGPAAEQNSALAV